MNNAENGVQEKLEKIEKQMRKNMERIAIAVGFLGSLMTMCFSQLMSDGMFIMVLKGLISYVVVFFIINPPLPR